MRKCPCDLSDLSINMRKIELFNNTKGNSLELASGIFSSHLDGTIWRISEGRKSILRDDEGIKKEEHDSIDDYARQCKHVSVSQIRQL